VLGHAKKPYLLISFFISIEAQHAYALGEVVARFLIQSADIVSVIDTSTGTITAHHIVGDDPEESRLIPI
jgi:hypothetical protein